MTAMPQTSRRGHVMVPLVLVGIATCLLSASISSCSTTVESSDSIRAELLHREHLSSPFRSPEGIPHNEKLYREWLRSANRARTGINRRAVIDAIGSGRAGRAASAHQSNWETTVTNAAPAEYLMRISLGTPPQDFVAVADTGSDLTWVQCSPCKHCFQSASSVFDPHLSSTYQNLSCSSAGCRSFELQYGSQVIPSCVSSCEYSYFYGDASNTTGTFSSETINLKTTKGSNVSVPGFWFGCSDSSFSPSALYDSSDGLVGLGQGLISFPSQLGPFFGNKFSYCLVNRSLATVQSSPLIFGKDVLFNIAGALHYTPILSNPVYPFYYYISLVGILVDGVAVNFSAARLAIDNAGNGGMIIDSGTTFSSLATSAFRPLVKALNRKVPYPNVSLLDYPYLQPCYNVTGVPFKENLLPRISFKFANASSTWDLRAQNSWIYLENAVDAGSMTLCLAIGEGFDGDISILGNVQQQDFHVVYDRSKGRIGFAPADCGSA